MALEDTYPLPKPHKRRVSAYLSQAKQRLTKYNGGGVNTHILTNVVDKATEVAKTPKEFVSCHKKCKHRGMRRINEQRKKRCVGKLTNYHRGRNKSLMGTTMHMHTRKLAALIAAIHKENKTVGEGGYLHTETTSRRSRRGVERQHKHHENS
jgi:hypothetical protein